ncbi:uncharacterized protein [Montipora capricornis]|uniref:uncharacterized protein isoform X1 n=1 Tax=Montipora capricornis TaxID=246305 RepID=UPI0035F110CC
MTLTALKERIVLILVSSFLLGKFGHYAKAWDLKKSAVYPDNKVVCQGQHLLLNCRNSSKTLVIYSATYGRTEPGHVICPYPGDEEDDKYYCGEVDVTSFFQTKCGKRERCKVKVDSIRMGVPCRKQHHYLILVYTCELQKDPVIVETPSSSTKTVAALTLASTPTLPTTSSASASSITILPNTAVMVNISSSVLVTQSTTITQESSKVHTTDTETRVSTGDKAVNTLKVEQTGSSATQTGNGSLGVAGALFVWFLFLQDHSSDYVMVFFTAAACALVLAVISGVCVLYCHRESKQHLHVADDPKLSAYEINDSKASEQVDQILLGPVKTSPPDYMLHGYDWNSSEDQSSQKNSQNGSEVLKFNAPAVGTKGMNGQSRMALDVPQSGRCSNGHIVRVERPDGSTVFLKSSFPNSEETLRSKKGRYVNVEDYRKARNRDAAKKSEESFFYYPN